MDNKIICGLDSVTIRFVNDADFGFAVWSLCDNDVLLIISRMILCDKSVLVYAVHAQKFYTIESFTSLISMIVDSSKCLGNW